MMTFIDDVSLGYWLADYYALATIVLLAAGAALARLRQPARRLSVSWSALGGLAVLVILGALPSWPRAGWPSRPLPTTPPRTLLSSNTASGPAGSPLPRPTRPAAVRLDPRTEASTTDGGRPLEVATRDRREALAEAKMGGWPPIASRAFLAGGAVMLAWLGIGSWQTASLRRRARQAPDWSSDVLARIVGDGTAAPRLLVCDRLHQPVAVGLLRPTVILPDRFLEDEPGPRLEAVLEHEWAHIRNRDLWLIALSRLLMPILFAHPAYWWLRRRIRDDQEILADAHAATVDGRVEYAEILLSWASVASERPWAAIGGSLALWERPSQLKRRIIMLLDRDFRVETTCPRRWRLGVRGGMALAVLALSFLTLRPAPVVADPPPSPAGPTTAQEAGATPKAGGTAKVVDPDGKPVAGAEVYRSDTRIDLSHEPKTAVLLATTGPDGSFPLPEPPTEKASARGQVVVMADGYGPALMDPSGAGDAKALRLVQDNAPIKGRVLDLQGRPISGAKVQLVALLWHPGESLDEWLKAVQVEINPYAVQYRTLRWWTSDDIPSLFPALTTDRDGRFTLKGLGRERIASLLISGQGIETRFEYAATRAMPPVKAGGVTFHGATFDLVAGPDVPISGTVRAQDTGQPLAGATVQTTVGLGNPSRHIKATTDVQGRYRLSGIPPKNVSDRQKILAQVHDGPPYVQEVQDVGPSDGARPITRDFQLKRGIWVRGRVVDKATGKGVRGDISYYIPGDNPHLADYPRYGAIETGVPYATGADDRGVFQLIVMPGPGILGVRAWGYRYRTGVGLEKIEGLKGAGRHIFATRPSMMISTNHNTFAGINPRSGDDPITRNLELDPGRTVKGTVLDPDGKPLAGVHILGVIDQAVWSPEPLPSAEFEVRVLGPEDRRGILFFHKEKKLAGAVVIRGDAEGPLTAKLEPWGTVTGRLVDGNGAPLAGFQMTCDPSPPDDGLEHGSLPLPIQTDQAGRFEAGGFVTGPKYNQWSVWKGGNYLGSVRGKEITVEAGKTQDLGDVILVK